MPTFSFCFSGFARMIALLVASAFVIPFLAGPAMAQAAGGLGGPIAFLMIVAAALLIYLIPTIVAFRRRHPNRWIIAALNVALGGTGIVWLGCLVWACGAVHKSAEAGGSDGGESGLNVFANDVQKIELVKTPVNSPNSALEQLERLKRLLDAGAINPEEFERLKAKLLV